MNNISKRYPAEVRERAVRMVLEHEGEYDSQWAAISSVASKLGMTPETLCKWVRPAEIDGGCVIRPKSITENAPCRSGRTPHADQRKR